MSDGQFQTFKPRSVGLLNDVFDNFLLGEKLGRGIDREVFVFLPDPDQVIKIETGMGNYQNVVELLTWTAACNNGEAGKAVKSRLAQVYHISPYGCYLRMERTYPPPASYKWPKTMPAGLTDFKRSNYGLTKSGRLVCHDYGTSMFIDNAMSKRVRKVIWWD